MVLRLYLLLVNMSEMPLNLKRIKLEWDGITVETKDSSFFVDVNPTDKGGGGVDYFILGTISNAKGQSRRISPEAVLLQNAPMPLASTHAARMATSIRKDKASALEASEARRYFEGGKAFAEQTLREFAEAIKQNRIEDAKATLPEEGLPPNRELTMFIKFRNDKGEIKQANVSVKMEQYLNEKFEWRLSAIVFEREGVQIYVIERRFFRPVEEQLMELHKKIVGGKDGIEAKLKKKFDAMLEKRKKNPGRDWGRY